MTNTTTNTTVPSVKVNTNSVTGGDFFYGFLHMTLDGKTVTVGVTNHIKDENKQYDFRLVSKCTAGFLTISDWKNDNPHNVISGFKKNALMNVQVKNEFGQWIDVFTTKGGKWYNIDLGFLKVLTVGDMRQSHPNMCDMTLWEMVGAKTWADKAFSK